MFESKVATVKGFIDEKDSASCSQTCTWIPDEYGGAAFVHEAAMVEDPGDVPSPSKPGSYARVVGREPQ